MGQVGQSALIATPPDSSTRTGCASRVDRSPSCGGAQSRRCQGRWNRLGGKQMAARATARVLKHPSSTPEVLMKNARNQSSIAAASVDGIPEWSTLRALRGTDFDQMVLRRQHLKQQIEAMETELSGPVVKGKRAGGGLNDQIMAALVSTGQDRIRVGKFKVKKLNGRTPSQIDGLRLMELGVDSDVIKQATVGGNAYEYILVDMDKEE